jgi:hypothetical protein
MLMSSLLLHEIKTLCGGGESCQREGVAHSRARARSAEANNNTCVILDPDDVCTRRACVEGDRGHTARCADSRVLNLCTARIVDKTAGGLAEEVAVEVTGCDRLFNGECIAPSTRTHLYPVEEHTRVDLANQSVLDGVLDCAEGCCSPSSELVTGSACGCDLTWHRYWCGG